jgi:hypothetical protein
MIRDGGWSHPDPAPSGQLISYQNGNGADSRSFKESNRPCHSTALQSDYLLMRYAHRFTTTTGKRGRSSNPPEWRSSHAEPADSKAASPHETGGGSATAFRNSSGGSISFHATGDTGQQNGSPADPQEQVSHEMAKEYRPGHGGENPAFLLHLGDVIYGHRKDLLYRDEYYRPYMKYPGKIVAIAGNHDGETFPGTDPKPCEAFLKNFCADTATLPSIAADVRIFRKP